MSYYHCQQCRNDVAQQHLVCPHCGQMGQNKNAPPPEVSSWIIERTPPDLLAWARQTFDAAEFFAEVAEIEQTGGVKFEDFIGEIEERVKGRG
jgi:hypothetical protein